MVAVVVVVASTISNMNKLNMHHLGGGGATLSGTTSTMHLGARDTQAIYDPLIDINELTNLLLQLATATKNWHHNFYE